jgi:hypothetical protein
MLNDLIALDSFQGMIGIIYINKIGGISGRDFTLLEEQVKNMFIKILITYRTIKHKIISLRQLVTYMNTNQNSLGQLE